MCLSLLLAAGETLSAQQRICWRRDKVTQLIFPSEVVKFRAGYTSNDAVSQSDGPVLYIQPVDSLAESNQHGIFLQLQLVTAIFTAAGAEIVLGHFDLFTSQQTLQMIVEQLQVDSLQTFKVIAAVSLTRRIDTVFIIVIHRNGNRTQAVNCHLNAQTPCRGGPRRLATHQNLRYA